MEEDFENGGNSVIDEEIKQIWEEKLRIWRKSDRLGGKLRDQEENLEISRFNQGGNKV